MAEKRFVEVNSTSCSDVEKGDIKCFDECREAAYELGYLFNSYQGTQSPKTQTISKSCYNFDWSGTWGQQEAGGYKWPAICRKKGMSILQYYIALHITKPKY